MAFLAAPAIPTPPDEPQAAGVLIDEIMPNVLVLTNAFLPAPTVGAGSASGGSVSYAG